MIQKPMLIANDIYTAAQGLVGSHCQNCSEYFFPPVNSCANCSSQALETASLGHEGKLWSWTIQRYMPKAPYRSDESPETFTPYGVGLIEMPCGVVVKSRIGLTDQALSIGQKMHLEIVPFYTLNGEVVHTYEFRQAEAL